MNEKHHASLKQYVNDVIGMERDIINAVRLQESDANVAYYPDLRVILQEIITTGEERIGILKALSEKEGGTTGAMVKEGITAITGTFAGLYGKIREHPVSRMVRDDIIAMNVATTSYGMLLTLGLAIGHRRCADIATEGLRACPDLVVKLTDLMPAVIFSELAKDAPLADPEAAHTAHSRMREAWRRT